MFYGFILACWIGSGCMLFTANDPLPLDECNIKLEKTYDALVQYKGVPAQYKLNCVTADELNRIYKEHGIEGEDKNVGG